MFRQTGPRLRAVRPLARVFALAALVLACVSVAKSGPPTLQGLVSIADGDPFTLIRGASFDTATRGVTLNAGDMIETGPAAFLVLEMTGGNLIGIGPSTQVYFMQRSSADTPTLVVLRGWVKADVRTGPKVPPLRVLGTRMGAETHQGVVLLLADARTDSVFVEQGTAQILTREDAATKTARQATAGQFYLREERADVIAQPRPSSDFIAKMPVPFRDPLPEHASAKLKKQVTPEFVRDVNYADVQVWLTIPRDWRTGFITRFRPRLKDPAFFAAMDSHMSQHPEWQIILHPPPPPDEELQKNPARTQATPATTPR
jgi:hypothetical protein